MSGRSDIAALARSLGWSDNVGFYFLVVDDLQLRETAVRELENALSSRPLRLLRLSRNETNVLEAVTAAVQDSSDPICVVGLENVIDPSPQPESSAAIRTLNASRDAFAMRFRASLVFVVSPHGLAAVATGAPDFFSTHSGIYRLRAEGEGLAEQMSAVIAPVTSNEHRRQQIERLRATFETTSALDAPRLFVDAAINLARLLNEEQQAAQAAEVVSRALPWAKRVRDLSAQAKLLLQLARAEIDQGRLSRGKAAANRSLEKAIAAKDEVAQVDALIAAASADIRRSRLERAEALLHEALAIADRRKLANGRARVLTHLAIIALRRGNHSNAEMYLNEVLVRQDVPPLIWASATALLAQLMLRLGRTIEAEALLRSATEAFHRAGDRYRLALAYADLGATLELQERHDEAESAYVDAWRHGDAALPALTARVATKLALLNQRKGDADACRMWAANAERAIGELVRMDESGQYAAKVRRWRAELSSVAPSTSP